MQEQLTFCNPVLHLFLRSELSSNTQVNLDLVKGRFKFWIIVFLTMKDNLCHIVNFEFTGWV